MEINREAYIKKLEARRHNGMVKIVTGVRRCGKTFLLFNLFAKHLVRQGVKENHIVKVDLDNFKNRGLRKPDALYDYVVNSIVDDEMHYVLLTRYSLSRSLRKCSPASSICQMLMCM